MSKQMTVAASEVQEGDFLVGLDNGYVFEGPSEDVPPYESGYARGPGLVSISFHTAEGDEGELIVPAEMPVTVKREGV